MCINFKENKGGYLLAVYVSLRKGEEIQKVKLAQRYCVTEKTIQRDIEDLHAYLADCHTVDGEAALVYDRVWGSYYLTYTESEFLENSDVLAICKILRKSRILQRGTGYAREKASASNFTN